ncbi:MAG: hypothetical protein ACO3RV_07370 [Luteolibacter sp.]
MSQRKNKPIELRAVDDDRPRVDPVVRLQKPGDIEQEPERPVRLGPIFPQSESGLQRLFVPERDEVEVRSHEPGIESLIDDTKALESPELSWGERAANYRPIPWGWFILIALAILSAVAWSLVRVHESKPIAHSIRSESETLLDKQLRDEQEAKAMVEGIEKCLETFFSSQGREEWHGLIRHPDRVMPLIQEYYASHPWVPSSVDQLKHLEPVTLERRADFWIVELELENGQHHNLLLEANRESSPRIDWETMVSHQPMPWDEFARTRPQQKPMDFRVYVEMDNFYSHEFAESGNWVSLRLTALNADETLFGYLPRDHPDLAQIVRCLQINEGQRTSLILRLEVPLNVQSRRGVLIQKLMSPRWIYLDSPTERK